MMWRRSAQTARPAHGFTLIELLIVVAIIGVLVGLLLPAVMGALLTAKITQARADMRQVEIALRQYVTHWDAFPPTRRYTTPADGHKDYALPEELWKKGYLDGPLMDSFNPRVTYCYKAIGPLLVNDAGPTLMSFSVPPNFPKSGGKAKPYTDWFKAPVRLIIWSAGPDGPPEGLEAEDPAHWYPEKPNGIICLYYDGNDWLFSY